MSTLEERIVEARRDGKLVILAIEPKAVSIPEAARLVDLSDWKVRQLIDADRFPHIKVDGRIIVPVAALDEWLAENAKRGAA